MDKKKPKDRRSRRTVTDGPFVSPERSQQGSEVRPLPLYDMRPWWKKNDSGTINFGSTDDKFGGTADAITFALEADTLRHQRCAQCHNDRLRLHSRAGKTFQTPLSSHGRLLTATEAGGCASYRAVATALQVDSVAAAAERRKADALEVSSKFADRTFSVLL